MTGPTQFDSCAGDDGSGDQNTDAALLLCVQSIEKMKPYDLPAGLSQLLGDQKGR